MTHRTLWRLAFWIALAVGAVIAAPRLEPVDPTLHPVGEALVFGVLAGGLVFVALARRPPAGVALAAVPRRRLAARSLVLAAKSAQEEAIWRAVVLGGLAIPLGLPLALGISTGLFAGAHAWKQGRAALAHLLTGSAFGGVYLATGRLHAAIAAHGVYNVLVGWSTLAQQTLSVSDTGFERRGFIASEAALRSDRPMHTQVPTPPSPRVASLDGVSKSFGAVTALGGVDLELRRGEILALLGPNGAGKSTAVAIMLGLRRVDTGRALLFGRDPRDPAARRHVGAVLQEISFPPALRVRETVDLVRAHFPNALPTQAALARLELEPLADRDAAGLSGGQRRRLAVALALAGAPEALFLDEPTAGMDPGARRALLDDVVTFAADGGAVLLTTQQLAEAEEIASRVVVLVQGRVTHEGTVAELRARAGLTRVTVRAPSLPSLPGVASVVSNDERHVLYVEDADDFVAALVRSGIPFHQLEVVPPSLEDAFLALTGETVA